MTGTGRVRRRTIEILDMVRPRDTAARTVNGFILTLVLLNVLAAAAQSVRPVAARFTPLFTPFYLFSLAVFTAEYAARLWSCTALSRYRAPVRGRLRYAASFYSLIDLFAILPFYLSLIFPVDLRILMIARAARVVRIDRHVGSLRLLARGIGHVRYELLMVLTSAFIVFVFSSTFMYFAEHSAQPESFSSIPAAMWWAIVTLATVGYGDMVPVTPAGKTVGSLTILLSVATFAIVTAVVSAGIRSSLKERGGPPGTCPHCGRRLDRRPG